MDLFVFFIYGFLNIKSVLNNSLQKIFHISSTPKILSSHLPLQEMVAFYTCVFPALHIWFNPSAFSNELNYLKSLADSHGYNPSLISEALK